MNDLLRYFHSGVGRPIHKWSHYFDVYERHFSRFRGQKVNVLEIGVSEGGSLQMWRDYFGPDATIFGVDIDPKCKQMEEEGFQIFIGDQGSRTFWRDVKSKIPVLDLLIDDGSHNVAHQILTFGEMYDFVASDGIFFVEDCHTSYQAYHGGGHRKYDTFIEFSKDLIDEMNAVWSTDKSLSATQFTRTCPSIHFYDSVVVFEKQVREAPYDTFGGEQPERWKPIWPRVPFDQMEPLETLPKAGSMSRVRDRR